MKHRHILEAGQFDSNDVETIFKKAKEFSQAKPDKLVKILRGKTLACVFYEPSTRTSSSFIAAMTKLGGSVIPITQGVQFSSVSKGETLEDTIITLGQYADAIVLRHPEVGAAARAAAISPVPIINAGDGTGEHPTQALLDLYTIENELGRNHNLDVCFVGDLANGRTVHSLLRLLSMYPNNRLHLVSPQPLSIVGRPLYHKLKEFIGEIFYVKYSLEEAKNILDRSDVIYMTRVQRERFGDPVEYEEIKNSCLLTPEIVSSLKPEARIMHPLPRVNEIPTSIDSDPRAAYFRQVKSGLYVRMSLLNHVVGNNLYMPKSYINILKSLQRKIIKESEVRYTLNQLAFYYVDYGSSRSGVLYNPDGVQDAIDLHIIEMGDEEITNELLEDLCLGSFVATIDIEETEKCNGAWKVSTAAGPGKLVYSMGYFLSPTGKLMADRDTLSDKAIGAWEKINVKTAGSPNEGKPLDDHNHPETGEDSFHDDHHTPKDTSDDCKTWPVATIGRFSADAVNRTYSIKPEIDFSVMMSNHENFVVTIDTKFNIPRETFEETLAVSIASFFMEAARGAKFNHNYS